MKKLVPLSQLIENVEDPEQVLINPLEVYQVHPEQNPEDTPVSDLTLDERAENPFDAED